MYGTMITGRPDSNKADFGDDLFHGACFRLRLSDDGEIEAPRDPAELLADPGKARAQRQRLGGDAGAGTGRTEPVEGRPRRRLVVALLRLDHIGWNISRAGNRDDRIVEESDSGEVSIECGGDRHGIVAGRACLLTDTEIHHDVLDHNGMSSARRLDINSVNINFMSRAGWLAFEPDQARPAQLIS